MDERGIEGNPDKIKAIRAMKTPKSVKEVQKLIGCVAALGRFMSISAEDAEEAFSKLKEYLASLPMLVFPVQGEILILYVSVSKYSLFWVVVAEREKNQLPVYYISQAFRGSEGNYSEVEKIFFVVVMASRKLKPYFQPHQIRVRKLKPYFQSHQIRVRTNQPLKKILEGRNHSSRITDYANQLADFGIEYEPRPSIKAQALADFIAESTGPSPSDPDQEWKLYIDSSSTKSASGAGILIVSSVRVKMEQAVRFEFVASNNEAEYEV